MCSIQRAATTADQCTYHWSTKAWSPASAAKPESSLQHHHSVNVTNVQCYSKWINGTSCRQNSSCKRGHTNWKSPEHFWHPFVTYGDGVHIVGGDARSASCFNTITYNENNVITGITRESTVWTCSLPHYTISSDHWTLGNKCQSFTLFICDSDLISILPPWSSISKLLLSLTVRRKLGL